jgi:lipopolysaccharide biosynthesis glycosyltransferase
MIVFGDIDEIWQIYMENKNDKSYFASIMVDSIQSLIVVNPEYKTAYDKFQDRGFNAGIYITSAFLWKKNNVKENILKLLENSKGHFKFGTQPLLNIFFYKTIIELPTEWNVCSHTHSTDIPLITKIILDNNLRTVNVNVLSNNYIVNNNIKLIHFTGPSEYKYWTLDNFKKYGMQSNGFELLNRFYTGKSKKIFYTNLNNNVIRYFYFYLKYE